MPTTRTRRTAGTTDSRARTVLLGASEAAPRSCLRAPLTCILLYDLTTLAQGGARASLSEFRRRDSRRRRALTRSAVQDARCPRGGARGRRDADRERFDLDGRPELCPRWRAASDRTGRQQSQACRCALRSVGPSTSDRPLRRSRRRHLDERPDPRLPLLDGPVRQPQGAASQGGTELRQGSLQRQPVPGSHRSLSAIS